MKVGSLFSGIGAMDYGLECAGLEIAWQCEIDDFC
jgi:site-specific DNA-cytosine methylase